MRVCLDPGHGGRFPGAVVTGGVREADITLAFCERLGHYLRARGHEVVFTRTSDRELAGIRTLDLRRRCTIANEARADVFLSVHCNSHDDPAASGSETFYAGDAGFDLAVAAHTALLREGKLGNRGVKRGDMYVLRHTYMPAILVELGFLSNPNDLRHLGNRYWRENVACAMAEAIDRWGRGPKGEAA